MTDDEIARRALERVADGWGLDPDDPAAAAEIHQTFAYAATLVTVAGEGLRAEVVASSRVARWVDRLLRRVGR